MSIQRSTPVNEFLAKLVFLILPTVGVAYFLFDNLNQYFTILKNDAVNQTVYFLSGMFVSSLFHSFRFRFLPAFVLLLFVLYSFYFGLDNYASGEFDAFFIARRFQVFAILLTMGWVIGWGFVRLRYWGVMISVALLCGCIAVIAKSKVDTVRTLVMSFSPSLLYAVYIIFTTEQIYSYKDKSKKFWLYLTGRLVAFCLLAILLLGTVTYLMRNTLKETVANFGGKGKEGSNSMLHKNKDGTFNLRDEAKLRSSQGRSNDLLFCAHIDNFFPGTTEPNPLYLTAFYFTKFDTLTETFERDSTIPYNDLFEPDPSKMPLFATKLDSSVIYNSLGYNYRKIIDIEIFSRALAPETYLAPNAGFFIQPITVEKDFRQVYKSAFRAKSFVSELNSAYFVYNINKPEWRRFQEMRNEVLREIKDYKETDTVFLKYYTKMPSNENFKKITELAHKITDTATTPVDKVLALRNYFLSKNENNEPLYSYTDNPGEPDIPNASKLIYFLFENHKGYCAYFAGATLFMLRAIGIPSRIAVGFLTENRSDKNKGWYFYYAKQAHAWIQIYFPGFGWLDFDTTVGNTDARESPMPDGTPPLQPPKAWLAANGIVEDVDTLKKTIQMSVKQFVFHDKDYKLPIPISITMDMKVALVYSDSIVVPLNTMQKGDEGTAVSYAEALKNIEPIGNEKGNMVVSRFPKPAPVDEVYLKRKDVVNTKEINNQPPKPKSQSIKKMLVELAEISVLIIIIILALPYFILVYFKIRYNNSKPEADKAYWAFMASTYYLHITGLPRGKQTPMQYAKNTVEPTYGTDIVNFMNIYLKKKYANQQLNNREIKFIDEFLHPFLKTIGKQIKFKAKLFGFINPVRCIVYFFVQEDEKEE